MVGLTDRQASVLAFVREYIDANGRPPALVEIGDGVGISFGRARRVAQALVRKGSLQNLGGSRGLVPIAA